MSASSRAGLRLAGAVLVVLTVAAGGTASTAPDRLAIEAAAFDQTYAAYQAWFTGERDEQGTSYAHWRYTSTQDTRVRTIDDETDYARMGRGRDIALLRRDRNARPGFSLDYLHAPSSDEDLVLLGDRFVAPGDNWVGEPTQWVARPTTLADTSGWDPCATGGTAQFCTLEDALTATRKAVPDVPRTYRRAEDGTITARTGIRFLDLVAYDLTPVNSGQLALLQSVLNTLVPFTITIGRDGTFARAELNGHLAAPDATIEVQLGLEHRGVATAADFPASPRDDPTQVRHVDRLEWVFFLDAATEYAVQSKANEVDTTPPR